MYVLQPKLVLWGQRHVEVGLSLGRSWACLLQLGVLVLQLGVLVLDMGHAAI